MASYHCQSHQIQSARKPTWMSSALSLTQAMCNSSTAWIAIWSQLGIQPQILFEAS